MKTITNLFKLKWKTLFSIMLTIGLFSFQKTNASHFAGADLTYTCLGNNQYQITMVFYRDCSGIGEPTTADIIATSSSCSQSLSFSLPKKTNGGNFTNGEIISSTCGGVLSTCEGGSAFGLRKWVYEGVITLNSTCNDWIVSYSQCCRNSAISTLANPGSEALYTETLIKNNNGLCNNSPQFSVNPIGFACINQPFNFNQGATDPDGDSLAYEIDDPLNASGVAVVFAAGFSKNNPFSTALSGPFTLDGVTGAASFTPNGQQVGVFAVKVKEFRNGNLIGFVRRDMQIIVGNCGNNTLPVASGFGGTTSYVANICAGESFCSNIISIDPDANQTVTMTANNLMNGATFTVNNAAKPTGTLCWTPTAADVVNNPHKFTVKVKDDACPNNGVQIFSYTINVKTFSITTSKTNVTCTNSKGTATANVTPSGNYSFLWSNGATTAANTNLTAGLYTVTVTDGFTCSKSATVTVGTNILAINSTGLVTNASGVCDGAIDLSVNNGKAPYSYNWSNGSTLQDLSGLCPNTYTVVVTDNNGCTGTSSYTVTGSSNCTLTITLKGRNEGTCLSGGIMNVYVQNFTGTGSASIFDSQNVLIKTISTKGNCNFDGLGQGSYTVVLTDATGCTASGTAVIGALGCGAVVDLEVKNIANTQATVAWTNCGGVSHIVRYKELSANAPYLYKTVSGVDKAVLKNLLPNTSYSVRVKSICSQGKSGYSLQKLFCTLPCVTPKFADDSAFDLEESTDVNKEINNDFEVIPNPAVNSISLYGESIEETQTNIVIMDMMGKVVYNEKALIEADLFEIPVNISSLPRGVYTVYLKGFENGAKRFVKL